MSVPRSLAILPAAFCLCFLTPVSSLAQPPLYLRLSPELGLFRIEHTKELTSSAGSSSNTTTGIGPDFLFNLSVGHLRELSGNWLAGGELQFGVSSRQAIGGTMPATGSGPGAVGFGTWEVRNLVGWGVNLLIGRKLAYKDLQSYFVAGARRWSTETASEALDPTQGPFSDREVGVQWPWTAGIGIILPRERPVDIRLRYFRWATDWTRTHNVGPPPPEDPVNVRWDYKFTTNGIGLQVGFGTG